MKSILLLAMAFMLLVSVSFGQNPITLIETTFKLSGIMEKSEYFGLKKGDQLIIDFEETKGKTLKEIEISLWPNQVKFSDFKTSGINQKVIKITESGIYRFRFYNGAALGRVCKIKLSRIPADSISQNYSSTVFWKSEFDTTYVDKLDFQLISKDTAVYKLVDQVAKVHSQSNFNGSKTTLNFTLPKNTVGWSYYIGVNQAGQEAYQNATRSLAKVASPIIGRIPGYGPLAALALHGVSYITQLQKGEDVDYYIVAGNNVHNFMNGTEFYYVKKGKVINGFAQMQPNKFRGPYHVCLSNDNAVTAIQVTVKVTAVTVTENWDYVPIKQMEVTENRIPYLTP